MKQKPVFRPALSLILALLTALSLSPAALASSSAGMGNFKKTREYPGFSDVQDSDWYARDVRKAYELGLVNGKSDGRFDPDGSLTLAEAVVIAVNLNCIYFNDEVEPGGSPWYQNYVNYALDANIIAEGRYTDFGAKATRSDVARMFANCLDSSEYGRINRIAWVPDVTYGTEYYSYIYTLYNAGIVTGNEAGMFSPDDPISRAEAAAIINRIAIPSERRHISLTAHAPGEVLTAADGSFQISVPKDEGWTGVECRITEDTTYPSGFFGCRLENDNAYFTVQTYDKATWNMTLLDLAEDVREEDMEDGQKLEDDISGSWLRGMNAYAYNTSFGTVGGKNYAALVNFVETSKYLVMVRMELSDDCTAEDDHKLVNLLLSLDLTL